MTTDIPATPPVFHAGETTLHKSLGIDSRLSELGKHFIRGYMPDQHREFFAQLPWVHMAAIDSNGHPWATVRAGAPGFLHSPDDKTLSITATALAGEPTDLCLSAGSKISIVGLEPYTLRRNRLNATVVDNSSGRMSVSVDQSYGNCPKYIQKRTTVLTAVESTVAISTHCSLDQTDTTLIRRADTLFIASRAEHLTDDPRYGVDINHRGGLEGFITVIDNSTILIPDYKGNNFFNTLGNIHLDPRVGIQIIDFKTATLLNLQGTAEILTVDDSGLLPPDTGKRIKVSIKRITRSTAAFPFKLSDPEYSTYLSPPQ